MHMNEHNTFYPQPRYGGQQQTVAMHNGQPMQMQQAQQQPQYFNQYGQPVFTFIPGVPVFNQYGQQVAPPQQQAQPAYPQPPYGGQQQQQARPAFANVPMNSFGTMTQQSQQQSPVGGANTRYGTGTGKKVEEYYQQVAPTEQQPAVVVVPAIPLIGNEYPFLLADKLTSEKQILGGYFKYIIKGNIMNNQEVSLKILNVSEEDMVLSQDAICDGFNKSSSVINLKIRAIEDNVENYATEVTNLTEHIIGVETDVKLYNNMVNKATTLLELSSLLRLEIVNTSERYTAKFLKEIDTMLTAKVNDVFKYTLGSDLVIDGFTTDTAELMQYIETSMSDAEMATKYKYMLTKLFESLKADIADTDCLFEDIAGDVDSDIVKVTYIPSRVTICSVSSPTIVLPLDNIERGVVLAVNEISHPVLHKLIDSIFKGTNFSKGTILTLATENGTYNVRSSTLGYSTVVKI